MATSLSRCFIPIVRSGGTRSHVNNKRPSKLCRCFSSIFECPPSQAIVYETLGAPDRVVKSVEIPGRRLHNDEVCVKMLAAPINPSDINKIEGVYPIRPQPPAVGGNEGVGTVIAVGSDVKTFAVDDWVIPAHSTIGTWTTYAVGKESVWYRVPKDVPIEYLATVSINPSTAYLLLKDFTNLEPGQMIVQNGATSMVGQCVIQLAHKWGLQTINLVRDREDLGELKRRLKMLGATHVLSESELESINKKELFTGHSGPQLGLNCVGGSAASAVLKLLGEGGTMVTYGGMAKKPITLSTASLIFKDVSLRGFWLHKWLSKHTREEFLTMSDYLVELARNKELQYSMEKVSFSSFYSALEKSMGKHGKAQKQILIFD